MLIQQPPPTGNPIFDVWLQRLVEQLSDKIMEDVTFGNGASLTLQEDITFAGATTENLIKIPDNLADALSIKEGSNAYLTFVTTNSGEAVKLSKSLILTAGQLNFPDTQNASADVNTLDDYEEGTWTPTAADAASGGNTTTTGGGIYTKIGDVVVVVGYITNISTVGLTATNTFYMQGLPFVNSGTLKAGSVRLDRFTFDGYCVCVISATQSAINLGVSKTGVGDITVLVSSVANGTADIFFTITYTV